MDRDRFCCGVDCVLFVQNVIECPTGIVDLAQVIFFLDCTLLLYFGVVYFMSLCVKYQKKKWSFLSIFGAFVPGLNLLWMFMGELDCLFTVTKKNRGFLYKTV